MFFERLRYELQLMGKKMLLTPIVVMGGLALFAFILKMIGGDVSRTGQLIMAGLESLLPLSAGIIIATVAMQDTAIELQLSISRTYAYTAFIRLALIVGWTICISIVCSIIVTLLRFTRIPDQLLTWPRPQQLLIAQLSWLAPLFWFVLLGLCLALILRSRTGSSTLLGVIWLFETFFAQMFETTSWLHSLFLFPTTFAPSISFWLANRIEVLSMAVLFFILSWFLLQNTEGLLKGSSEE